MFRSTTDRPTSAWPASAVFVTAVAILFLSLFALETSDGVFRKNGTIAKSLYLFGPLAALFYGMLTRRRWALFFARVAAFCGMLWFYGWAVAAVVLRPVDEYGRVWIWLLCVSLTLGSILLAAFLALAKRNVTQHYGLLCRHCDAPHRGLRAYFAGNVHCRHCGQPHDFRAPAAIEHGAPE